MSKLKSYTEVDGLSSTETLVKTHAKLVKHIAFHLLSRLPVSVQVDDLIQSGMIGLLEAAQRFDKDNTASFETYASIRIRGSMLDELRKTSWMPRSTHQNMRKIASAIRELENTLDRPPKAKEIAEHMHIDLDTYYQMSQTAYANEIMSLDGFNSESSQLNIPSGEQPTDAIEQQDLHCYVAQHIQQLPEREKLIVSLYYTEKLTFKEIAQVLELTEARISQLHGQAMARLNARLNH